MARPLQDAESATHRSWVNALHRGALVRERGADPQYAPVHREVMLSVRSGRFNDLADEHCRLVRDELQQPQSVAHALPTYRIEDKSCFPRRYSEVTADRFRLHGFL